MDDDDWDTDPDYVNDVAVDTGHRNSGLGTAVTGGFSGGSTGDELRDRLANVLDQYDDAPPTSISGNAVPPLPPPPQSKQEPGKAPPLPPAPTKQKDPEPEAAPPLPPPPTKQEDVPPLSPAPTKNVAGSSSPKAVERKPSFSGSTSSPKPAERKPSFTMGHVKKGSGSFGERLRRQSQTDKSASESPHRRSRSGSMEGAQTIAPPVPAPAPAPTPELPPPKKKAPLPAPSPVPAPVPVDEGMKKVDEGVALAEELKSLLSTKFSPGSSNFNKLPPQVREALKRTLAAIIDEGDSKAVVPSSPSPRTSFTGGFQGMKQASPSPAPEPAPNTNSAPRASFKGGFQGMKQTSSSPAPAPAPNSNPASRASFTGGFQGMKQTSSGASSGASKSTPSLRTSFTGGFQGMKQASKDSPSYSTGSSGGGRGCSYQELLAKKAKGDIGSVDPANIETLLSDAAFMSCFGVAKDKFSGLPKWKRDKMKKDKKLF